MRKYLDKVYRFLMDKYNYSPNEIDRMDFFRTSDLIFSEIEEENELVYADEINW